VTGRTISIGLVGPLPPPSGGMANQTRQLARLLGEAGIRVELVQVNPPYAPRWIAGVRGVRALARLVPYVFRLWRCAGRVDLFHVMGNSGWAWHLFAAPAVWVARLRGKPVLVNYRGGGAEEFLAKQGRWVKPTLARAASIVVPSGFLQSVFAAHGIRAEIVPNVVDLTRFQPGRPESHGPHIVVTRNLEEIYDIPTAIRAFARIRARYTEARLTIAGSGPCRAALERRCAESGLAEAVRFSGPMDNERMADLYKAADLMLNPSRVDNMPISLLEAMASGVPVVSTNVGGVPYVVQEGVSALLVPPGDPEALARAALRILEDPELAARLRRAGLDAVQAYSWDRVRPRLLGMYQACLGREEQRVAGTGVAPNRE
jgi:glycosyltransferase involved in cell wall biosynthesis